MYCLCFGKMLWNISQNYICQRKLKIMREICIPFICASMLENWLRSSAPKKRSETVFFTGLKKNQPIPNGGIIVKRFVIKPRPVFARYVSHTYGDHYSMVHWPCNKYHLYRPVESSGILVILKKTWERFYNTSFALKRKTEIKNTFSTLLNSQN